MGIRNKLGGQAARVTERSPFEFAELIFTAVLVLWLFLVLLDFVRGVYVSSVLNAAAREGSRYAAVRPDSGFEDISAVVGNRALTVSPNPGDFRVEVRPTSRDARIASLPITVTVEYDLDTTLPVVDATYFIDKGNSWGKGSERGEANPHITLRSTAQSIIQ